MAQPSSFGRDLVKWLVSMCFVVLLGLSYIDVIYLPQKKMLEEQQTAINALDRQVQHLVRKGGDSTEAKKRLDAMEVALRRVSPETFNVLQDALREVEEEEKKKAQATTTPMPSPKQDTRGRSSVTHRTTAPKTSESNSSILAGLLAPFEKKKTWRDDHKCGKRYTVDGKPAECDPDGDHPCCAPSGWCGNSEGHCNCEGCKDFTTAEVRQSAPKKYEEASPKAIALVVPMRDRGVHLERFRERIQSHAEAWNKKGIKHEWMVFVVEQFDNALFNRGYLFNVGFTMAQNHAKKTGRPFDCVVMHDIDIIPQPVVDYGWCQWPNQIAGEIECWGWSVPYAENVGGVVSLSPAHWKKINGFSNEYDGWGGEDDDLYLRLKQHSLLKGGCHTFCKKGSVRPVNPLVYRPPLGKGRFDCLHDGDHTPRQRSADDQAMWQRLSAMKSNSKRWKQDGITSIAVNEANEASETKACDTLCTAPEDPVPRQRLFGELWARVSAKPIDSPGRLRVALQMCPDDGRPLQAIPAGLEDLRKLVGIMFPSNLSKCVSKLAKNWNLEANFLLMDVTLGQVLMVGTDAAVVVPDSSLPAVPLPNEKTKPPIKDGSEHMVQGQRLSRWIRKLPADHEGVIMVLPKASGLPELREQFVLAGRRWPMTVPACVSTATYDGGKKYRITPGTTWCGDGGWDHSSYFMVLRSRSNVPEDDVVPICISYNTKAYTYRFEKSENGCIGQDSRTGVVWKHAHTIHTARSATGDTVCVGSEGDGFRMRSSIKYGDQCDQGGSVVRFVAKARILGDAATNNQAHRFSFTSMKSEYTSPFARACILVTDTDATTMKASDAVPVRRLLAGPACDSVVAGGLWRHERSLVLLASPSDATTRICAAEGYHDDLSVGDIGSNSSSASSPKQTDRVWKVFAGDACDKKRVATREAGERRPHTHWRIDTEYGQMHQVHVPKNMAGMRLCQCKVELGAKGKAAAQHRLPFFTWAEEACKMAGAKEEFCFNAMTDMDIAMHSYLLDEVP